MSADTRSDARHRPIYGYTSASTYITGQSGQNCKKWQR